MAAPPEAGGADRRPRRAWRRVAIALAGFVLAFSAFGFLAAPPLIRHFAQQALIAEFGRPVTIERVAVNPWRPSVAIEGLRIAELAGQRVGDGSRPLLSLGRAEVVLSWTSVFRFAPVVDRVAVVDPALSVARLADGRYSVQDLIEKWLARPSEPDKPLPRFAVANISLTGGRIDFDDQPVKFVHVVRDLVVRVPFVSTLPMDRTIEVTPLVSALVNDARVELAGETLPFSERHESDLELELGPIDLPRYLAYSPVPLPVQVKALALRTQLRVVFAQAPRSGPEIDLSGAVQLLGADVREPGGEPLLAFEALSVALDKVQPLARRAAIGRVSLERPVVVAHRRAGQPRWFDAVLGALERGLPAAVAASGPAATPASSPATTAAARPEGVAPTWSVAEVVVTEGRLELRDDTRPAPLRFVASDLRIAARQLSSDPAQTSAFELAFAGGSGERLAASGSARAAPLQVDGELSVEGVVLRDWWPQVAPLVRLELLDGKLGAATRFSVAATQGASAEPAVRLSQARAELTGLWLRQTWDKADFLRVPTLAIADVEADLAMRTARVGSIASSGGRVRIEQSREDGFNVERLVVAPASRSSPSSPTAAPVPVAAPAPAREAVAAQPWRFVVDRVAIERWSAQFRDELAGAAANLEVEGLRIAGEAIGNQPGRRGKVSLGAAVNRTGRLQVQGQIGLEPLAARVQVDASRIGLVPLQPYFSEFVNIVLNSGDVTARGEASFEAAGVPGAPPRAGFRGAVALSDFNAVTRAGNEELLRWRALDLKAIEAQAEPLKVSVGEVALADFFARIILSREGRLNLQDIVVPASQRAARGRARTGAAQAATPAGAASASAAAAPRRAGGAAASAPDSTVEGQAMLAARSRATTATVPGGPGGDPPDVRIGRITLVNGNVDFSDFFIRPNYSANLTGMNGFVGAMSPTDAGNVELRGRIDNTGAVEVLGRLNPLARDLFLDLAARATDIDLPRLSPYSGKYVGYGIEKGKLSASVKYRLESRQLQAENNVVLDQLTFGDRVESPTALKLPVLFAVSLLKDRDGRIDINLPISGSIDDPQFSVGPIIFRVLVNLLVKAVTSPFALLGALAGGGGGEELAFVDFAPGSARLEPAAQAKMQQVARALTDRPALRLELTGRADPEADREVLRRRAVDRLVKAQKQREIVRGGASAPPLDEIVIEPGEAPRLLTAAYRAADIPKPRNAAGLLRELPQPEMEQALLASVRVSDDALRELANERAEAIKAWFGERGGIAGERVFVTASRLGEGGPAEPATGTTATAAASGASPSVGSGAASGTAAARRLPHRVDFALR